MVCYTYAFEVIKDCDLSEVFKFDTDIAGTEFEPYYRTSLDGTGEPSCNAANPELFLITRFRFFCQLHNLTIQKALLLTGH